MENNAFAAAVAEWSLVGNAGIALIVVGFAIFGVIFTILASASANIAAVGLAVAPLTANALSSSSAGLLTSIISNATNQLTNARNFSYVAALCVGVGAVALVTSLRKLSGLRQRGSL